MLVILALRSRLDSLGLLLSMQLGGLRLVLTMLGYMVLRLLVVALAPLAILLLMREEMLHWLRVPTGPYRLGNGGGISGCARVYIVEGGRLKNMLVGWRTNGEQSGVVSLF